MGLTDPRAYVRLAAIVRQQIIDGKLRPGGPAPSITFLSQEHGHARPTCIGDEHQAAVAITRILALLFRLCSVRSRENDGRRPSMIISVSPRQQHDRQHARCSAIATSDNFTIFEGTGLALTGTQLWATGRIIKHNLKKIQYPAAPG